jgi:heme/copper-type cytochrome/quinol oxidase subunit 2
MSTVQIVILVLLIISVIALLVLGISIYNLTRIFNNNYKNNETNRIKSRVGTTS